MGPYLLLWKFWHRFCSSVLFTGKLAHVRSKDRWITTSSTIYMYVCLHSIAVQSVPVIDSVFVHCPLARNQLPTLYLDYFDKWVTGWAQVSLVMSCYTFLAFLDSLSRKPPQLLCRTAARLHLSSFCLVLAVFFRIIVSLGNQLPVGFFSAKHIK